MKVLSFIINENQSLVKWINTHECTTIGWMVHGQDTCFSLGSYLPTNIPIVVGFKNVPRVLKLRYIQLDGLKTRKQGWCICNCCVTPTSITYFWSSTHLLTFQKTSMCSPQKNEIVFHSLFANLWF